MSTNSESLVSNGGFDRKVIMILIGLAAMVAIIMAPTPAGLSMAGQRILAIMVFTIFMWITEAIPYNVSAISLIFMSIAGLGFAPASGTSGALLGTGKAIPLAMSGFSNSGWVFVASGLFMAAAIVSTGIERRIAYMIIRMVGTKINAIMAGIIITSFVLTFLIPSVIARGATLVPISLGLITAFGLPINSQIGKAMLLLAGILPSVTGNAVLTGAAPNPIVLSFLKTAGLPGISYIEWMEYLFPFTVVFAIGLYFLVIKMFKFEFSELPGGREYLNKCLDDLGPMSVSEKKILIIMVLTILLWATDKLHHIDATAVSVLSVLLMVSPYSGVCNWKDLSKKVDWNTILLFGAGISMADMFTNTGAAKWVAKVLFIDSGVGNLSITWLAISIFLLMFIIRFCFTSITSCIAAVTPAIIGFLVELHNPALPITGIIMGVLIVAQSTAILPVTSAPAMIAYGTGGFTTKDMVKLGIPLAVIMYVLILVFMFTYWPLIGLWR
ncbi:anion transporter [Sporomusaceae bacterium BoRhaA]|uniref:SLC13 family permease n=1 Tax=Pelorhabdus rhamnosifermentans TaxID=2772457 RepID=UPI001C064168|nr:DASS family sodium-coupled anion symporter [Pelorhabdus rhamnosifermentans]MBU2699640.1 anion transporter [Pelorhabdus rhamnosifermentans]